MVKKVGRPPKRVQLEEDEDPDFSLSDIKKANQRPSEIKKPFSERESQTAKFTKAITKESNQSSFRIAVPQQNKNQPGTDLHQVPFSTISKSSTLERCLVDSPLLNQLQGYLDEDDSSEDESRSYPKKRRANKQRNSSTFESDSRRVSSSTQANAKLRVDLKRDKHAVLENSTLPTRSQNYMKVVVKLRDPLAEMSESERFKFRNIQAIIKILQKHPFSFMLDFVDENELSLDDICEVLQSSSREIKMDFSETEICLMKIFDNAERNLCSLHQKMLDLMTEQKTEFV